MNAQNEAMTTLAQQIERLREDICPNRFRYTHEFLQLACVAAQRESNSENTIELAQLTATH